MHMARASLPALAIVTAACAAPPAERAVGSVIDLTHAFDADTIYWPTEEGFVLERGFAGRTEAGYYYEAHRFRSAEHGGTHLDAPIHFAEGRRALDEIPVEQLVGPGVAIDVSSACEADPDHAVTRAELEAWEGKHGRIPDGAIVLLRTGFGRHWPDRERYLGTAERGPAAVAALRFPGLSSEAARWLAEARRIRAVGIDTASIDPGRSERFEAHQELFEREVPALENVAHLDRLPPRGFRVVALPMKIRGGSGGPLRVIAILD
ncbi:MAG: cyclase family protein [Myxococcota bacterium]|nr:cyclase family protein [Myxococcota bacterium]